MRSWVIFQLRTSCEFDQYVLLSISGSCLTPVKPRSRLQVCRRLRQATYERSVWLSAYERSDFLLKKGPLSSQFSSELEHSLIRAAKINKNWTSGKPTFYTRRRFPRTLPTYDFDSNIISGRFLQLAESTGLSWYDLDANDMATPILTYTCGSLIPFAGYIIHQVNAGGEGPDSVWVSFICNTPRRMYVQPSSK